MSESVPSIIYQRRDFGFFVSGRFLSTVAMQIQSVAIGWQVYELTDSAMALGIVGLCQFAPMFLLTLPAGDIADRFDQRKILSISMLVQAVCSALFLLLTLLNVQAIWLFYLVLVLFGAARGFSGPAGQSLVPFLVPESKLARSIALSSSVFTTAVIAGPALGGFLYAAGHYLTYSVCCLSFIGAAILTVTLGGRRRSHTVVEGSRYERVADGIRFVMSRPIILGAISLDLFAVLLGGAVALLPIYARDILHIGPEGLGILRAAPAVGAAVIALTLAKYPLQRHTGRVMFYAVAVFGICTVIFGLSTNFYVSLVALFILGAADMISVFVRSTLIQFATPDHMRGRVSGVNMLFIGASNELGDFESGAVAAWLGVVPAVVIGGVGTLAIVGIWMWRFPQLRLVDRVTDAKHADA